jgi:hypothetical protein
MLIDPFQPEWQSELVRVYEDLPHGASLKLLIDSAFVPKLFQQLSSANHPILLFEFLPGCSKEAKEVSPFVVSFDPRDKSLMRLLKRCSGWPMLNILVTYESTEQLAKRLAAWCIVEVDGKILIFGFQIPDACP